MPNMNEWTDHIGDRELLEDAAITQRHAAMTCAASAAETINDRVFAALENILHDELAVCHELSALLLAHGWQNSRNLQSKADVHIHTFRAM